MKKVLVYLVCLFVVNFGFAKLLSQPIFDVISYENVEVKPMFPGGITEFMNFVMKNFHVSEDVDMPTGTIQVSMVIDKDGNVANVKILKDLGGAGNEIKRVLTKCPKWQPGRMQGQNVDVEYIFPITIK